MSGQNARLRVAARYISAPFLHVLYGEIILLESQQHYLQMNWAAFSGFFMSDSKGLWSVLSCTACRP